MVAPEGVAGPPKLKAGPPLDPGAVAGAVGLTEPLALAGAGAGLLKLKPEKTDDAGAAAAEAANGLLDTAAPGVTAAEAVAAAANGLLTAAGAAGAAPKTNAGLAADVSTDEPAGLKLKEAAGADAAG